MIVKDVMTKNLIFVYPETSITEAKAIMTKKNISKLPVLDKNNQLVGLITKNDMAKAGPSDATSLDMFEIGYLLSKLTVEKFMTKKVVTVSENEVVEEAAKRDFCTLFPFLQKGQLPRKHHSVPNLFRYRLYCRKYLLWLWTFESNFPILYSFPILLSNKPSDALAPVHSYHTCPSNKLRKIGIPSATTAIGRITTRPFVPAPLLLIDGYWHPPSLPSAAAITFIIIFVMISLERYSVPIFSRNVFVIPTPTSLFKPNSAMRLFISMPISSLFEATNAISIPENRAEKSITIISKIMSVVIVILYLQ